MMTLVFIKDILAGRRRLMRIENVQFVPKLEKYPELTVESLLNYARKNLQEFFEYLPAEHNDPAKLSREYCANVSDDMTRY